MSPPKAKKKRPKLLRDSLRELGIKLTAAEFTALVLSIFGTKYHTFTVDELLCDPETAIDYCCDVRCALPYPPSFSLEPNPRQAPNQLILRTLVGARKRKAMKHEPVQQEGTS